MLRADCRGGSCLNNCVPPAHVSKVRGIRLHPKPFRGHVVGTAGLSDLRASLAVPVRAGPATLYAMSAARACLPLWGMESRSPSEGLVGILAVAQRAEASCSPRCGRVDPQRSAHPALNWADDLTLFPAATATPRSPGLHQCGPATPHRGLGDATPGGQVGLVPHSVMPGLRVSHQPPAVAIRGQVEVLDVDGHPFPSSRATASTETPAFCTAAVNATS